MNKLIKDILAGALLFTFIALLAVSCTPAAPAATSEQEPEPVFQTAYEPEIIDWDKIWTQIEEENARALEEEEK